MGDGIPIIISMTISMTREISYNILKTEQDKDIVQLKTNSKSYVACCLAPAVPVTLNDPNVIRLLQLAVCMCGPAAVAELLVL